MSQIETNKKVANAFVELKYCRENHKYETKSKTKIIFNIPFLNTHDHMIL